MQMRLEHPARCTQQAPHAHWGFRLTGEPAVSQRLVDRHAAKLSTYNAFAHDTIRASTTVYQGRRMVLCRCVPHVAFALWHHPSTPSAAATPSNSPRDQPPAQWEAWAAAQLERERAQGLAEYANLKDVLLQRLQRVSALLALYLLFVSSGEVAACSIVGSGASYAYLRWLMRDVDAVTATDPTPMVEVDAMRPSPVRTLRRLLVGYRYALQPRLLVPVALGAAQWWYNTQLSASLGLEPLSLADECGLLAGFLSYKLVLWSQIYEETKPKFDPKAIRKAKRPQLVAVEDVSQDLSTILQEKDTKQANAMEDASTKQGDSAGRQEG